MKDLVKGLQDFYQEDEPFQEILTQNDILNNFASCFFVKLFFKDLPEHQQLVSYNR